MANTRLSPEQANKILHSHMERQARARGPEGAEQAWRRRVVSYAPGESVLNADAQGSRLCLVVRGQLGVYTAGRREGRPLVVLTPGKTFGQTTPAISPPNASLRALTRCEIWFLEHVASQPTDDSGRHGTLSARRTARLSRLVPVLLVVLLAALLLAVPTARAALGVLPMSLGDWCGQHGHTWCARQAWSAAGIMAPQDAGPALAQGMLAVRQNDLEQAEAAFEKARAVAPSSPEAVNNLGVVYYRRGEYQRAAAAFRQALLMEPGSALAEQNLGDSLLAAKEYDESLSHYRTALGLGAPRGRTLANMAVAYYQTGQLPDAQDAARSALLAQPDLPGAYMVLGVVALEARRPEEALQFLSRAKELEPEAGEIDYYLGLAYVAAQQPAEAATAFRLALARTSDEEVHAEIGRHLAALQEEAGEGMQP